MNLKLLSLSISICVNILLIIYIFKGNFNFNNISAIKKVFTSNKNPECDYLEELFVTESKSKIVYRNAAQMNCNKLMSITEQSPPEWTHEGQQDWNFKYAACASDIQSPIDLINKEAKVVRGDCLLWNNYTDNMHLILNNNGHTIEGRSTFDDSTLPTLEGGPLNGKYNFDSMHWHWGRNNSEGSEHNLNSKAFPIELHFIHYNSKFASALKAIASGEVDALAVIGILFELSDFSTPGMKSITDSMLKARDQGVQKGILPLSQLGLDFSDDYYTYLGSLTTPPCYSIVRWIVLKNPLPITKQDLRVFRAVMVDGHSLINNYRKIQPFKGQVQHYSNCIKH